MAGAIFEDFPDIPAAVAVVDLIWDFDLPDGETFDPAATPAVMVTVAPGSAMNDPDPQARLGAVTLWTETNPGCAIKARFFFRHRDASKQGEVYFRGARPATPATVGLH